MVAYLRLLLAEGVSCYLLLPLANIVTHYTGKKEKHTKFIYTANTHTNNETNTTEILLNTTFDH